MYKRIHIWNDMQGSVTTVNIYFVVKIQSQFSSWFFLKKKVRGYVKQENVCFPFEFDRSLLFFSADSNTIYVNALNVVDQILHNITDNILILMLSIWVRPKFAFFLTWFKHNLRERVTRCWSDVDLSIKVSFKGLSPYLHGSSSNKKNNTQRNE